MMRHGLKQRLAREIKRGVHKVRESLHSEAAPEPLTMDAYRKLSERCAPFQFLTYRHVDQRGIWCADHPDHFDSFLVGWELSPVIIGGEKAERALAALLNKLPTGSVAYSIAQATDEVEPYLEGWALSRFSNANQINKENERKQQNKGKKTKNKDQKMQDSDASQDNQKNDLFSMTTLSRAQYLRDWAKHGLKSRLLSDDFRPRRLRFFWFVNIKAPLLGFSEVSEQRYTQTLDQVVSDVEEGLLRAGLGRRAMSGEALLAAIRGLANPHIPPINWQSYPLSSEALANKQVLRTSTRIVLESDGILRFEDPELSEKPAYQRVLTATGFPDSPHPLQAMQGCIGSVRQAGHFIPGPFYAYTMIECLDKRSVLKDASLQIAWLEKQTTSSSELYRTIMREHYDRKENIKTLYEQLKRARPVKVITGLVMSAENRLTLESNVEIAKQQWSTVGIDLTEERAIAMPMWLASLPGQFQSHYDSATAGLQRGTTMTPLNAATLTHVQSDWVHHRPQEGGLLLMSRRGDLSVLNVFDSLAGYNGMIAAITGSGKSFLTAEMVNDFLSRGGMARIIDAGRSYLHLANLVSGQNLIFQRGSGLCLNPYSYLHTKGDLEEHLSMLHSVTSLMAFPQSTSDGAIQDARQFQTDFIRKAIPVVWDQLKEKNEHLSFSVKDIADYCAREGERLQDQRISDIAVHLHPWGHGEYAKWVVGQANVNFDNPMVVLELDDLSQDPLLQRIVLSLVISQLTQEMYQSSERERKQYGKPMPKLLIIDEAWKLLNHQATSAFIEEAYRRARKYSASVWVISQSFSDAKSGSGAGVAIQQSNWILGLMQDKGPLLQAVESHLIDLSEYEIELIQSIHKTDLYSEVFVKNKSTGATGLYRLAVDPMTYWTYTTKGEEREKLDQLLRSGVSLKEAVEQLSLSVH